VGQGFGVGFLRLEAQREQNEAALVSAVGSLASELGQLGGTLAVLHCPPAMKVGLDVWGSSGDAQPLMCASRSSSTGRTLNPGPVHWGNLMPDPDAPETVLASPAPSVFDDHNAPAQKLIDECVHCGFCLPTCPTYALWHEEMDFAPRPHLSHETRQRGQSEHDEHLRQPLRSLPRMHGLRYRVPVGRQYDKLIEATRAQIERHYPRSFGARLQRRMIFAIFPHPGRLRLLLGPICYTSDLGCSGLCGVRAS